MLDKINLEHILFLDIETVPQFENYEELEPLTQELWEAKTQYHRKEEYTPEEFYERAGIWAEFGKIICISVGYFHTKGEQRKFRVTSFYGEEKQILIDFKNLLETHFSTRNHLLCAHNGKEGGSGRPWSGRFYLLFRGFALGWIPLFYPYSDRLLVFNILIKQLVKNQHTRAKKGLTSFSKGPIKK